MSKKYLFFKIFTIAIFCIAFSSTSFAQEKREFLMHRYDGYTKLITKNFTEKKLKDLKNDLNRQGVLFIYKNLVFNKKKEIISISIQLKNNKSKSKVTLNNKKPIPNTEVGEIDGIVVIVPNAKKEFSAEDFKKSLY